ncbi:hypothetical protein M5E06_33105 [Azospirillum sp. A1-3]|uniref:hypothetical protein n=1 Tax=Azospirillum sp. A1-3 TaxID=185874 RepID=UPI00207752A1|nr:hypothetical protein [Azospirillum sp. A1-3]MCM8738924.1 hypothetical protein [Azospirillum sp. A1-3]
MIFDSKVFALTVMTLLLAACQTQRNPDGSYRATSPTIGQILGQGSVSNTPMASQTGGLKPGEQLLTQTAEGWKVIYADLRKPGQKPFRYCAMDWTPGGVPGTPNGVTLQISEDKGLRLILDTTARHFNASAPIFKGIVRFNNGVKLHQRFQAVDEHVAWMPPGSFDAPALMRNLANSTSMSLHDSRGVMVEVPTRTAGEAIKVFNHCTLNRL